MEDLINRFRKIHGDKYDYSKVIYNRMIDKVNIICPVHGVFPQSPHSHLKGMGCPECGKESRIKKRYDTSSSFIEKAKKIHGDKYDYSKVEYVNSQTKVCIICPEHGEFWQKPNSHLSGQGCKTCKTEKHKSLFSMTKEEFIEKAKAVHGDKYDYSKVEYVNNKTKVCIICPEHGEFWQLPSLHLSGSGCGVCSRISSINKRKMTTEEFIEKAKNIHGDKYDYSKMTYITAIEKVTIICPIHGEFEQVAYYHLNGNGCQECAKEMVSSQSEREIFSFIKENYDGKVLHNYRGILEDRKEIDIYIPSLKIAFEFDGLYWHNEKNQPLRNYHLNKTKECLSNGIQLIHIFEDEWLYKKEIVKSRILNLLGKTKNKIFARKCIIKEIDSKIANNFLNENHIQGKCNSKIKIGLYYNNELVSVMTFGGMRKNMGSKEINGKYELIRFCNKLNTNVIGGASKLFKYFIKEYEPNTIISYADKRWSIGKLYEKLGFKLTHESQPSYFYVINDKRHNRFNFRKDVLVKEGYNSEQSEHQIMLGRNIYRIYDCGCLVFEY